MGADCLLAVFDNRGPAGRKNVVIRVETTTTNEKEFNGTATLKVIADITDKYQSCKGLLLNDHKLVLLSNE